MHRHPGAVYPATRGACRPGGRRAPRPCWPGPETPRRPDATAARRRSTMRACAGALDLALDPLGGREHLLVAGRDRHLDATGQPRRAGRGAGPPRAAPARSSGAATTRWANGCWPHTAKATWAAVRTCCWFRASIDLGVVAAVGLAAAVDLAQRLLEQLGPLDQLAQLEHEHAGPLAIGQQHADRLVLAQHRLELAHGRHVVDDEPACAPAPAARSPATGRRPSRRRWPGPGPGSGRGRRGRTTRCAAGRRSPTHRRRHASRAPFSRTSTSCSRSRWRATRRPSTSR